jgi:thiol-disulfide isomerase/thioredoxin
VRKLAQQVLVLGQARQGKTEKAKIAFLQYLKEQPPYTAEQNIGFALQLASEVQLQQQYSLAADIYGYTARRFALNPQIRDLCKNKVAKLRLINESAPPIAALDIAKKRVDISSYRGKVLLIDFWATNCPPCLEELPHMKRLYEKYHPRGLEILGISLDVHQKTVVEFQRDRKIPWRLMMIEASAGSLRQPYKVASIPSVYLVNRAGKVVQFDLRGHDLAKAIGQLIESPNSP